MKRFSLYITEAASMKIMLLGGPGSGKSTYSEAISKHFGIPHIYPGDILRKSNLKQVLIVGLFATPTRDLIFYCRLDTTTRTIKG